MDELSCTGRFPDGTVNAFDGLRDVVFINGREMRIAYQNATSAAAFGKRLGAPCHEAIFRSETPCSGCPFGPPSSGGAGRKAEVSVTDSAKAARHFDMATSPARDGGGRMTGCIVVGRDVTAAKAREEQRRDSLSMLSHDLRSPITAIQGFAELLHARNPGLGAEAREMLALIKRATTNTSELLDEFLTLSSIESGRLGIRPEPVPLAAIVKYPVEKYRAEAEKKRMTIKADIPPGLPNALLDLRHSGRVVSNLVHNAVAYGLEGGEVRIRAGVAGETPPRLYLEVSDNGPGISPDELPHIFERYFRGPHKGIKGTGLGLAIVKAITELHGGEVEAKSVEGMGTTIRLILPAEITLP